MSDVAVVRSDPASAPALLGQPLAPDQIKPLKERPISKRLRKVIDLLLNGECKTQKAACERVGMNADHVSRELAKPRIQAFITRESRKTISQGTMRASARFLELIDAESEHVAAKVTERLLTSEGILKGDGSQVSVSVGVSVGYVIDLSGKAPTEKVIDGTG